MHWAWAAIERQGNTMAMHKGKPYVCKSTGLNSIPVMPEQAARDKSKLEGGTIHNVKWHDKDYHDKVTLSDNKIKSYGNTHITLSGKKGA